MLARVSNSRSALRPLPPSLRRRSLRGLGSGPSTGQIVGTTAATGISVAAAVPSALPALIGVTAASVVGLVAAPIIGIITAIFGAHAAKVAQEANTLNTAVPAFYVSLQAIVAAANNGQISASTASSYIDQAVSTYYAQVNPIIKKAQACTINSDCSAPGGSQAGDVSFSPCNGPCSMGCNFIEPAACQAKALLNGSGGSVALYVPTGSTNGFNGLQPITVSYTPQTPVASPASVTSANSPSSGTGLVSVSDVVSNIEQDVSSGAINPLVLGGGLLAGLFLLKAIL